MFGDTVLHTAAMLNAGQEVVELLVSNGADVIARNKEGVTPLEISLKNGDIPTIKYLAQNGANIHTQNTRGESPLSFAMLNDGNELLEAIVNETNVLLQDSDGNTPLHIALIRDAQLSKVQYIISLSDEVNIRNKDGNSALYYAVMKNRKKVGEILLEKNADIFSTNTNNNSPLRLALKYGGSIQDWLITSKTINATDGSGNTPLHYAAEWEYAEAITSLLQKGSIIGAKNANGETALFNAVKANNPEIIQLIIDGGAEISVRDN
jgi:ankyrin repeat protein